MFRQNATRRGDRVAKSTLVCRVGTVMTVHHGVTWCNHPPDNWETMENHGKPWKSMENCIVLKLHHFRFVAQITFRARGFLQNFSSIVINCRFHSGIQLCLVVTAAMSRHSIEFVTEPVWSDEPFTKPFPRDPRNIKRSVCADCCQAGGLASAPKVRGIPNGSTPMPEEEEKDLLKKLEGNWHIQVLEKMPKGDGKYRIQDPVYDQVMVQDNFYVLSGGTRIGLTMKELFHFYQGPKQEIYCDYIGSQLVKMDFEGGEVEVKNGLGERLLWQRTWKKDGSPPPQQSM